MLFFDEATSGLDVMARRAVLDFCRRYPRSSDAPGGALARAVIYSTHVMSEVEELCDRVAILYQGRLIATDGVAGLLASTGSSNLEQAFFQLVERSELAAGGNA